MAVDIKNRENWQKAKITTYLLKIYIYKQDFLSKLTTTFKPMICIKKKE